MRKRTLTLLLKVGELLEERGDVNNDTSTNNRGAVLVNKTYSHIEQVTNIIKEESEVCLVMFLLLPLLLLLLPLLLLLLLLIFRKQG
jgi:hypothetical protein